MKNKLTKREMRKFTENLKELWVALKSHTKPEYHTALRTAFKRIIREDEREFAEFVELMQVGSNEKPKSKNVNEELQESAYDAADLQQDIETGAVTHQCHYCGDMYHVSDLSGTKVGLICYKCRHEMENRD